MNKKFKPETGNNRMAIITFIKLWRVAENINYANMQDDCITLKTYLSNSYGGFSKTKQARIDNEINALGL